MVSTFKVDRSTLRIFTKKSYIDLKNTKFSLAIVKKYFLKENIFGGVVTSFIWCNICYITLSYLLYNDIWYHIHYVKYTNYISDQIFCYLTRYDQHNRLLLNYLATESSINICLNQWVVYKSTRILTFHGWLSPKKKQMELIIMLLFCSALLWYLIQRPLWWPKRPRVRAMQISISKKAALFGCYWFWNFSFFIRILACVCNKPQRVTWGWHRSGKCR